jgi:replicative DNA helicase
VNSVNLNSLPRVEPGDWEPLVPFGLPVDLPSLPLFALPDAVRCLVEDIADVVDVEPDLPYALVLPVIVGAGGGGFEVQVGESHLEVLAHWSVATVESGERKTAVVNAVSAPVNAWESEALMAYGPVLREYAEGREVAAARQRELRSRIAKAKSDDAREALQRELYQIVRAAPPPPPSPALISKDATPEMLALKMSVQFGRSLIVDDEGGLIGILRGRYQDGDPHLDVYLKGHAGSPLKVERIGREANIVARPALSMALAVQPEVVDGMRADRRLRGVGMFARMNVTVVRSRAGSRTYRGRRPDDEVRRVFAWRLRRVLEAALRRLQTGDTGYLRLAGVALEVWAQIHNEFDRNLRDGGPWAAAKDWGSKAAGTVARLAGGFHLLEHGETAADVPISSENVERAAQIVQAQAVHSVAVIASLAADQPSSDGLAVLRWAVRHGFGRFTESKLHEHLRFDPTRLALALKVLQDRRYVREAPRPERSGRGRPPSKEWELRPGIASHSGPGSGSDNSGNSGGETTSTNSLNILNPETPPARESDLAGDGANSGEAPWCSSPKPREALVQRGVSEPAPASDRDPSGTGGDERSTRDEFRSPRELDATPPAGAEEGIREPSEARNTSLVFPAQQAEVESTSLPPASDPSGAESAALKGLADARDDCEFMDEELAHADHPDEERRDDLDVDAQSEPPTKIAAEPPVDHHIAPTAGVECGMPTVDAPDGKGDAMTAEIEDVAVFLAPPEMRDTGLLAWARSFRSAGVRIDGLAVRRQVARRRVVGDVAGTPRRERRSASDRRRRRRRSRAPRRGGGAGRVPRSRAPRGKESPMRPSEGRAGSG